MYLYRFRSAHLGGTALRQYCCLNNVEALAFTVLYKIWLARGLNCRTFAHEAHSAIEASLEKTLIDLWLPFSHWRSQKFWLGGGAKMENFVTLFWWRFSVTQWRWHH